MTHAAGIILGGALLAQASSAAAGADQHVIWAIVLLGMAAALFVAEVFVPSGGVIGVLSALCLIGGIIMLFWIDTTVGLLGTVVTLAALPFAFAGALKLWPSTPIGRALTLGRVQDDDDDSPLDGQAVTDTTGHAAGVAVGTQGRSLTELRPVGTCLFDGRRHECLAVSGVIEPDTPVRVVSADGMQIKVRPA